MLEDEPLLLDYFAYQWELYFLVFSLCQQEL